jgi:hypothetical protein
MLKFTSKYYAVALTCFGLLWPSSGSFLLNLAKVTLFFVEVISKITSSWLMRYCGNMCHFVACVLCAVHIYIYICIYIYMRAHAHTHTHTHTHTHILWLSSFLILFHSLVSSSILGPKRLPSTLFPNILSVCVLESVWQTIWRFDPLLN